MKLLITGSKGQIGYYLQKALSDEHLELFLTDRNNMDITDYEQTNSTVATIKPDIIIHSAAYTSVDACETNPNEAYRVNALGTRNLAIACNNVNAKMLYISTDFVFDGTKESPYIEFDEPNPLNIYGKTKLAGEEFVKSLLNKFFIVRTSWLYGSHGNNFVKTIQNLAKQKGIIKVVDDQTGSPTFAEDLVEIILQLIKTDYYGIYHCSNDGQCSWYEFAKKIIEYAGLSEITIQPITSEELNRPAKRPNFSVLKNYMLELQSLNKVPHWMDSLESFLQRKGH